MTSQLGSSQKKTSDEMQVFSNFIKVFTKLPWIFVKTSNYTLKSWSISLYMNFTLKSKKHKQPVNK